MYSSHDVPAPVFAEEFASWARIAVKLADHAQSMSVLRLDRQGLAVAVDDLAALSPIGLPRQALIVADAAPLCELRLVVRTVTRVEGQAATVTMQPSRADDHLLLWQALREHQLQMGASSWSDQAHRPSRDSLGADLPRVHAAFAGPRAKPAATSTQTTVERETRSPAARLVDSHVRVGSDAAFTLANHDDACFFASWLEYHFAETRARARMCDARADLRETQVRVADHEVEVRFVFRSAERVVRASTEAACRWIAAEAMRQLSMRVEYWLSGTPVADASPVGWPRSATIDLSAAGYSS